MILLDYAKNISIRGRSTGSIFVSVSSDEKFYITTVPESILNGIESRRNDSGRIESGRN